MQRTWSNCADALHFHSITITVVMSCRLTYNQKVDCKRQFIASKAKYNLDVMITINEIKNHPNVLVEPPNRHGSFHLVCSQDTLMVIPIGTWSEGCAQQLHFHLLCFLIVNVSLSLSRKLQIGSKHFVNFITSGIAYMCYQQYCYIYFAQNSNF